MKVTRAASSTDKDTLLKLSDELGECSFHRWHEKFEKVTTRSAVIRIPRAVIDYLRDEIVVLPKECYPSSGPADEHDGYDDDDDGDTLVQPEFPAFSETLADRIAALNGSVFIKTNWHCAQDAYWITAGQTLKVTDITDAYQLLKASSRIKNDLCNQGLPLSSASVADEFFVVVLKEWQEFHPGTEFRCFVRNRRLIAISPRDWPEYHSYVVQQRHEIVGDIVSFFKEYVKEQFSLTNFVFDVVRASKDQVQLVDFSPFNEKLTKALAFDWDQLNDNTFADVQDDDPEFRYLPNDCGIQPTSRNNYGIPLDIIEMFSGTGIAELLRIGST